MSQHEMTPASITCAGCRQEYAETALFCPNCGRPKVRETQSSDPLIGKLLGERFQVQEYLGQGASGTIYRAEHVTLRRKVAIKVLHNELSRDDLAVERFRREATTVAEIDNEHIVEIHDFGRTPDGRLYLAMELLEGETLDLSITRDKTLSVERAADILIQVGEALMEAHAIGYVHRDLRPRNIYLAVRRGKANFVKLLDFGLSKLVESDAQAASTSLGMTFGDPRYMSPEQARGDRIDRRADIYQLGCVAYEMLTGAPPFVGNRVFDILTKQVTEIPAPLPTKRSGVPLWMEASVAKMLAKDPENRFATTTRMVEALRRGLETGEVMEDEIARRRESIPPPSVSRVMQRMGMTTPAETPREVPHMPQRELPPLPAATVVGVGVGTPSAAEPARAEPAKVEPAKAEPVETWPAKAEAKPEPEPAPARRRTGTPQLGVPAMATASTATAAAPAASASDAVVQPPVTGVIEAPSGRAKSHAGRDPFGISQAWYEDGERASDDDPDRSSARPRKPLTASHTDASMYEEPAHTRRWPIMLGIIGGVGVIGALIAFAMTRDGGKPATHTGSGSAVVAAAQPSTPPVDAAPSQVIESPGSAVAEPPPAPGSAASPPPAHVEAHAPPSHSVAAAVVPVAATHDRVGARTAPPPRRDDVDDLGLDDPSLRRPGGAPPSAPRPQVTQPLPTPPPTPKAPPPGVSGAEGPQDPYNVSGTVAAADPGDSAAPDKKAEFYASLGQSQLGAGDTAGAAANFKKAVELDPKNVNAVIGMGDIALRQGLFGDAIAHLKKAARMSPRSSTVFTLLGEAYLNSGQNAIAADNFKKALQLDPDNARAREGYNDASSKVPPAEDDR
jgi:eukaryotic-like serine/threonine-protein kinase